MANTALEKMKAALEEVIGGVCPIHRDEETGKQAVGVAMNQQDDYVDFLYNDDGSYYDMRIVRVDCHGGKMFLNGKERA
jgi:hypothetical protein